MVDEDQNQVRKLSIAEVALSGRLEDDEFVTMDAVDTPISLPFSKVRSSVWSVEAFDFSRVLSATMANRSGMCYKRNCRKVSLVSSNGDFQLDFVSSKTGNESWLTPNSSHKIHPPLSVINVRPSGGGVLSTESNELEDVSIDEVPSEIKEWPENLPAGRVVKKLEFPYLNSEGVIDSPCLGGEDLRPSVNAAALSFEGFGNGSLTRKVIAALGGSSRADPVVEYRKMNVWMPQGF